MRRSLAQKAELALVALKTYVAEILGVTAPITLSGGQLGISPATDSAAGSMSAADKTKLDGILGTAASLTQATWFIDRVNGLPTASGIDASHPVDSAATIRSRWNEGLPGVRPVIPASVASITVTWLAEAVTQPDIADPINVLLDIDFAGATQLILQSSSTTVALSGTLATASAFARTSAGGQISITDGSVADFHPFNPTLFHDKTSGAVGWLYEPKSANATGIVSRARAATVAGSAAKPAAVAIAGGDLYELLTMPRVYLGASCNSRQINSAASGNGAGVFLYRLWATSQGSGDIWRPQNTSDVFSIAPIGTAQECRIDQSVYIHLGDWQFINCGMTAINNEHISLSTAAQLTFFAGFGYQGIAADGGLIAVDGDFVLDGNSTVYQSTTSGILTVGTCSRWGTSGQAFNCSGGHISVRNIFDGAHITYGTVGAANNFLTFTASGQIGNFLYSGGNAVATFQFDSTKFSFPVSGANGWSFNQATGLFGGASDGSPTTNTCAHLDAAINSPGFGGLAIDPPSGCVVRSV